MSDSFESSSADPWLSSHSVLGTIVKGSGDAKMKQTVIAALQEFSQAGRDGTETQG